MILVTTVIVDTVASNILTSMSYMKTDLLRGTMVVNWSGASVVGVGGPRFESRPIVQILLLIISLS